MTEFPKHVRTFLHHLMDDMKQITGERFVGCYLHGSLAMGSCDLL